MNGKNTLCQLQHQTSCQMMSYVLSTKDGKLIVIDGGTDQDAQYLVDTLKRFGGPAPVVDGWFLTHAHFDHITAFMEVMEHFSDEVTVKKVYYNFQRADLIEQFESHEAHSILRFNAMAPKFSEKCRVLHKGDVIDFGEARFTALTEPDAGLLTNIVNNSTVALKMELCRQTVLFLGDLGLEAGDRMLAEWGSEALKSDFVQMAHHGQNGVSRAVYEAARPKACLWNTPVWLWNNDAGGGYDTHVWQTVVVRGWMEELGVRHHFITKDQTWEIDFPFAF